MVPPSVACFLHYYSQETLASLPVPGSKYSLVDARMGMIRNFALNYILCTPQPSESIPFYTYTCIGFS